MKITFILLASFFTLTAIQAEAATEKKVENQLLKCVRESLHDKRMDEAAMKKTYLLLADFGIRDTEELVKDCKKNDKAFKKNEKENYYVMNRHLETAYHAEQPTAAEEVSYKILKQMMEPTLKCKVGSIEADVAIGVGLGLGLGFGHCKSDDGRVWGMFVPFTSSIVGGGATVIATYKEFTLKNGQAILDPIDDAILGGPVTMSDNGFGIGLAMMKASTQTLAIKVLPIGNDFRTLRAKLHGEN